MRQKHDEAEPGWRRTPDEAEPNEAEPCWLVCCSLVRSVITSNEDHDISWLSIFWADIVITKLYRNYVVIILYP